MREIGAGGVDVDVCEDYKVERADYSNDGGAVFGLHLLDSTANGCVEILLCVNARFEDDQDVVEPVGDCLGYRSRVWPQALSR